MIDLTTLTFTTIAISAFAFWRIKKASKTASKAPVAASPALCEEVDAIALPEPESSTVAAQAAELLDAQESIRVMPMDYTPGHSVNLTAVLRDLDAVFPQIPVRPTTTIEEIQFNAGQRCLADWMRQQYLARGKQAGSMSKAPTI